jgi:predicted acylesterase/phospholipase RssA
MTAIRRYSQRLRRVMYFFPLQLLVLHVKKNHMLLVCWLLLFLFVTESIGVKYGVPYLFLYPEYFGTVSFISFAITGFALGGFITAFNLYSYTMHGYRFPFIATLARPFLKFNVNNAIIPALFVLTYLWCSASFQYTNEFESIGRIAWHLFGFVFGMFFFLGLALLYFTSTNTDIDKLLGRDPESYRPEAPLIDIGPMHLDTDDLTPQHNAPPRKTTEKRKANRWLRRAQRTEKWRVETYLSPRGKIMLARSSSHYDREMLRDVLWQNHINGSIFEMVLVLSFIALGAFSDIRFFAIPAGASAILFLTMLLMIVSALWSWLQGWTGTVIIGTILILNIISHRTSTFFYDNQAYGLDYTVAPAPYDRETIAAMANDTATANSDALAMEATLELWKERNAELSGTSKPPLVLLNTSGGGLRALLWTLVCMQHLDSVLDGTLMDRTTLMAGSSGGLIGAAYYRQLFLDDLAHGATHRNDAALHNEVSSDMLNPMIFSFVTNDMFIRYRKVFDGDRKYTLDRGYTFEQRLNANTRNLLDVRLRDLHDAEKASKIPMLMITPTSINDGRRLLIGSVPASHLTSITPESAVRNTGEPESIEFARLFAEQGAADLKLTSALRMNASFPYITPVVTLPSEPPMRAMDAGVRDNYGYRVTLAFLNTYRHWIAENTSGVVIIQLRDTPRRTEVQASNSSMFARLLDPVGSIYDNFLHAQDQDYDLMVKQASGWADFPVHLVDLELQRGAKEQIALSWHLTALERKRVLRSLESEQNQAAFELLKSLLPGVPATAILADGSAPALVKGPARRP